MNSFKNNKYLVNKHVLYEGTVGGECNVCEMVLVTTKYT
jgi:hypothetical protein